MNLFIIEADFFWSKYRPNKRTLCAAKDIKQAREKAESWFIKKYRYPYIFAHGHRQCSLKVYTLWDWIKRRLDI